MDGETDRRNHHANTRIGLDYELIVYCFAVLFKHDDCLYKSELKQDSL